MKRTWCEFTHAPSRQIRARFRVTAEDFTRYACGSHLALAVGMAHKAHPGTRVVIEEDTTKR